MIGSVTVVVLRVGVVVAVALVVAAAANLVLLGVASRPRDPVGRLSQRASRRAGGSARSSQERRPRSRSRRRLITGSPNLVADSLIRVRRLARP